MTMRGVHSFGGISINNPVWTEIQGTRTSDPGWLDPEVLTYFARSGQFGMDFSAGSALENGRG